MSTRIGVNSNCPRCHKPTRSGYCRDCAEMSRVEEVESTWDQWGCGRTSYEVCELALEQARTLAAEVDELRAKLDQVRSEVGCARGQQTTQFCAEAVEYKRRLDAVVKMLEPGYKPNHMDPKYNPASRVSIYDADRMVYDARHSVHARAVAIAEGRDNG